MSYEKKMLEESYNEIEDTMRKLNVEIEKVEAQEAIDKNKDVNKSINVPQQIIDLKPKGLIDKIYLIFKKRKFKKNVRVSEKLKRDYKKQYDMLKEINIQWVHEKNALERRYVEKINKMGINLNKIENNWLDVTNLRNKFKEELFEIKNDSLILLRDNNDWYAFDGLNEGIWTDPIYNNIHYIDSKKFRNFKFGGKNIRLATGNIKNTFLDSTDIVYDSEILTGMIMTLIAQVEKSKFLNKKDQTGLIFKYILIGIAIIVGLIIFWKVVLPLLVPSMKQTVTNGAGGIVDTVTNGGGLIEPF